MLSGDSRLQEEQQANAINTANDTDVSATDANHAVTQPSEAVEEGATSPFASDISPVAKVDTVESAPATDAGPYSETVPGPEPELEPEPESAATQVSGTSNPPFRKSKYDDFDFQSLYT